jgi:hypothetical protein
VLEVVSRAGGESGQPTHTSVISYPARTSATLVEKFAKEMVSINADQELLVYQGGRDPPRLALGGYVQGRSVAQSQAAAHMLLVPGYNLKLLILVKYNTCEHQSMSSKCSTSLPQADTIWL